jgi:hypothetical protein
MEKTMLNALLAALKWVALCLLPYYVVLFLIVCAFMALAADLRAVTDLWPVIAILCFPVAGMVAASQSIPPPNRH